VDSGDLERASEFMRRVGIGDELMAAVDGDAPLWVRDFVAKTIDAYRAGDVGFLLDIAHPEIVIVQPRELPDARTYRGPEGMVEALLDWPLEWDGFAFTPKRIFAPDDSHVIIDAIHSGRSRAMGIEIAARIVWLHAFEDARMRRWDMFVSVDDALAAL
jgi:ketosteroid isomerase-like protein